MTTTFDYTDKTIIVTGAGSGIGKSIAQSFLNCGANVVVCGRRVEKLEQTIAGYPSERCLAISCDVAKPEQVQQLITQTIERYGNLDCIVSNAAAYANGEFAELSHDSWRQLSSANIDGFVNIAQHGLPELEKTKGTLIAVSSVSGLRGDWGQAAYNATKAAISNFVQSLALDYGAKGVRVNAVAPSFTVTEMTGDMAENTEVLNAFNNRIALGRPAKPEDIAPAVMFLASEQASYITGVNLPIDGGTTASTGQPHL